MAELVGLISGGAGLASLGLQLLDTAVKLRQAYHSFKEAPERIERLTDEIEVFGLILQQLERDRQAHGLDIAGQPDALQRCIQLCRKSVSQIERISSALGLAIKSSKRFGKLKSVFEEKEILQLCEELERAKNSLGLAHQLYTESRRSQDYEQHMSLSEKIRILVQQHSLLLMSQIAMSQDTGLSTFPAPLVNELTTATQPMSSEASKSLNVSNSHANARSHGKHFPSTVPRTQVRRSRRERTITMRFRPWIVSKLWNISITQATSGWKFQLFTINIVPRNALIFNLCSRGDLLGVQRFIDAGRASLLDQDPDGWTLLDECLSGHHFLQTGISFDLVKHILAETPSLMESVDDIVTAFMPLPRQRTLYEIFFQDFQMNCDFLTEGDNTVNQNHFASKYWSWSRTVDCQRVMMKSTSLPYYRAPLRTRLENAIGVAFLNSSPEAFCEALGNPDPVNELAEMRSNSGCRTALHGLAENFNDEICPRSGILLAKLVRAGADLHATDDWGHTALMSLLQKWIYINVVKTSLLKNRLSSLRRWLAVLSNEGVDIQAYGERELQCSRTARQEEHNDLWLEQTLFTSNSEDCDLWIRGNLEVKMWRLQLMPGSWPLPASVPTTISWDPKNVDLPRGSSGLEWQVQGSLYVQSKIKLLSKLADEEAAAEETGAAVRDTHQCLLLSSQDDGGTVHRGLCPKNAPHYVRPRRCRSQPPDVRDAHEHRFWGHSAWDSNVKIPDYLRSYHRCREDGRWRFGGIHEWIDGWGFNLDHRACADGRCQETYEKIWVTIFDNLEYEAWRRRGYDLDD